MARTSLSAVELGQSENHDESSSEDAVVRRALSLRCDSLAQVPLAPLDAKRLASIDDFVRHEMTVQRIPGLELGIYGRGQTEGDSECVSTYRLSKGGDAVLLVFGLGADRKISRFVRLRNREYE